VYAAPIGIPDDQWYGYSIETAPHGNDTHRIIDLYEYVLQSIAGMPAKPLIVGFEDYGPVSARAGKILLRAELCGMLKLYALTKLRIPVVAITPNALKKYAVGNGNAKKDQVMQAAAQRGFYAQTTDEADAFFVSRLASDILCKRTVACDYSLTRPD
jgi:Holliday junction resolvasome RuvABC endonuclease subunit